MRDRVVRRLSELGLRIVSAGSRSISIESSRRQFEVAFECRLAPTAQGESGGFDFGAAGHAPLRASCPPRVPDDIRDEVDSIEIQEPPLLF